MTLIHRSFSLVILSILALISLRNSAVECSSIVYGEERFFIIIDAGSTGNRLHIHNYTWPSKDSHLPVIWPSRNSKKKGDFLRLRRMLKAREKRWLSCSIMRVQWFHQKKFVDKRPFICKQLRDCDPYLKQKPRRFFRSFDRCFPRANSSSSLNGRWSFLVPMKESTAGLRRITCWVLSIKARQHKLMALLKWAAHRCRSLSRRKSQHLVQCNTWLTCWWLTRCTICTRTRSWIMDCRLRRSCTFSCGSSKSRMEILVIQSATS